MEDKQQICNLLAATLKATRNQSDLKEIIYTKIGTEEHATLIYEYNNTKLVNVAMDSGTAMIRDIMRAID